jgi:hypothetical protein
MPKDITVDGITTTIPDYQDVVDGENAFTDLVNDLAAAVAARVSQFNGTVQTAITTHGVVRNIHLSTGDPVPTDGIDGDVWIKYA